MLIAHRGLYNDNIPENSIKAFDNAFNNGYDGIELDVRLTKDKIPVIIHDSFLSRVSNGHGLVSNYTFRELLLLNFNGEKICTLLEVTERYKNRIILIELKEKIDIFRYLNNRNTYYISSFYKDYIFSFKKGKYKLGVINYIFNSNIDYKKIDFIMILDSLFSYDLYNYYNKIGVELVIYGVIGEINSNIIDKMKYVI